MSKLLSAIICEICSRNSHQVCCIIGVNKSPLSAEINWQQPKQRSCGKWSAIHSKRKRKWKQLEENRRSFETFEEMVKIYIGGRVNCFEMRLRDHLWSYENGWKRRHFEKEVGVPFAKQNLWLLKKRRIRRTTKESSRKPDYQSCAKEGNHY